MEPASRRTFLATVVGASAAACSPTRPDAPHASALARLNSYKSSAHELATHEANMRKAIRVAAGNPRLPFGSVIVRASDNAVLAEGVNNNAQSPLWHGEVVALNDYTAKNGNSGWHDVTLYTTGEPCAMCAGAIIWAGIPRVVWASSVATIRASGEGQIDIPATEVAARAEEFYKPEYFLGGVLADQTDPVFLGRPR